MDGSEEKKNRQEIEEALELYRKKCAVLRDMKRQIEALEIEYWLDLKNKLYKGRPCLSKLYREIN